MPRGARLTERGGGVVKSFLGNAHIHWQASLDIIDESPNCVLPPTWMGRWPTRRLIHDPPPQLYIFTIYSNYIHTLISITIHTIHPPPQLNIHKFSKSSKLKSAQTQECVSFSLLFLMASWLNQLVHPCQIWTRHILRSKKPLHQSTTLNELKQMRKAR